MITIYHNPRCSKSRRAVSLARAADIELEIIDYLKTPPDTATLMRLVGMLGGEPHALIRKNEPIYRTLKLGTATPHAQLIAAVMAHPILLERPLITDGIRAVVARPPELIESFL